MTQAEEIPLNASGSNGQGDSFDFLDRTKYSMALTLLVDHITLDEIPPVLYLKLVGELFCITLAISWVVSIFFVPEVLSDNPIKDRLGYNNVCVGWDMPPSKYFANMMWPLVVYAACRFCYLNFVRIRIEKERGLIEGEGEIYVFQDVSNWGFLLSVLGFTVSLMISPWENIWWHTVPFLFYMVMRYAIVLAICRDFWYDVSPNGKIFVGYYGFVSLALPIVVLAEYSYYSIHGEKSPWPWYVTMGMDYSWFFCTMVTAKYVPSSISIHRTFDLISPQGDLPKA